MALHKILLIILILSLLSIDKIIPQDSLLSQPEIKNYIQFLEKENGKLSKEYLKRLSKDSIKIIASLRYQAFDKDYIAIYNYLSKNKKIENGIPAVITASLGEKVFTLIEVSYLLKMKINSINKINYTNTEGDTYPRIEVTATILEVIKGVNKYKLGDVISFFYLPDLRRTSYKFIEGETVFSGILTFEYKSRISTALYMKNDNNGELASYGRYPIENGFLIDRDNAWGYGKSVPWEEFKKKLTQDISNIISAK